MDEKTFRKYFCKDCCYIPKENGWECPLPSPKRCELQDWRWIHDNAIKYASFILKKQEV